VVVLLLIVGGLLGLGGFFGALGIILASPVISLTDSFAGLTFSTWSFTGLGVLFFAMFLAGIYLIKAALSYEGY